MRILLGVVGGFSALIAVLVLWLLYRAYAGGRRAYARLAARLAPVAHAIAAGRAPSHADLVAFAAFRCRTCGFIPLMGQAGEHVAPAALRDRDSNVLRPVWADAVRTS